MACGDKPLAIHIDGIIKLYRWTSAQGFDLPELYRNVGFVEDSVFEIHAEKINKVKPKVGKLQKIPVEEQHTKRGNQTH